MIIDFHTHTFPDKMAEKTIAFLSEKGGIKPYREGTARYRYFRGQNACNILPHKHQAQGKSPRADVGKP